MLKPTHTANDRVLFVPIVSLYAIEEHDIGMVEQAMLKSNFNWRGAMPAQTKEWLDTRMASTSEKMEKGTRQHFKIDAAPPTTLPAKPTAGTELLTEAKPAPTGAHNDATATGPAEEEPDAYTLDAEGNIVPELPKSAWQVSAILVKTRAVRTCMRRFGLSVPGRQPGGDGAVNPAGVMREFFETFLARAAPWCC